MKKHYDFLGSVPNPYTTGLENLNRALADYRVRKPMTVEQFQQWWDQLSPDVQDIIDAIVPLVTRQ